MHDRPPTDPEAGPARRARLAQVGWEQDLAIERGPVPAPAAGQVLIEVEASGVCHRDCIDRDGRFPFLRVPITPGHEAVGRVTATGSDVTEWQVGDRVATMHRDFCGRCARCDVGDTSECEGAAWVFGLIADGGYASHLITPERALYGVPDDVPAAEAAILCCTFGTAYRGLRRGGGLGAGRRVAVTGANGGVGVAAVELCARAGAEVVAVVRDGAHADALAALGAAHVVVDAGDRFHKGLPGGPVDVVLDCVGQPTINASLRAVRLGGAVVVIGNVTSERASINLGYLVTRAIRLFGSSGATRGDMQEVLALRGAKPFAAPVRQVPLEAADEAQREVRAGGLRGRIVLVP